MRLTFQLSLLSLFAITQTAKACEDHEFQCQVDGFCIPEEWRCDQSPDCTDFSDESGCDNTCSSTQLQCQVTGICIPLEWRCDGKLDCCFTDEDCGDNTDEDSSQCISTCSSDQFSCVNGRCIPSLWRCDQYLDCGEDDTSDEKGCDYPTCLANQFTCDDGNCIDLEKLCNEFPDCIDASDEKKCDFPSATPPVCQPDEFQCKNGECVPLDFKCDSHTDCSDGSDEDGCRNFTCSGVEFTCKSGLCISGSWLCDGTSDCEENEDEEGCDFSDKLCPPMHWPCPENGECIPIDNVCDDTENCLQGGDEGSSCGIEKCGQLSCEYSCHESPDGGVCYCENGYVWDAEIYKCVDYDECVVYGTCDQFCQNLPSTYKCSCEEGYQLQDGKNCKALGDQGKILVSAKNEILIMDTNGGNTQVIATSADAMGLDYHYAEGKVYWTDDSHEKVYATNIDGSGVIEEVLDLGLTIPIDIAVDWVGKKLYIAESMSDRIDICELNGTLRSGVITDQLKRPRGLALDPTEGYMFFSEHEDPARIERAYMDGSNRIHLVSDELYWPYGITVDIPARRIYWVDGRLDYVGTATYDGLYREKVASGSQYLPYPFHIAMFEDYIYLTDWTLLSLVRVKKLDTENNFPETIYSFPDSRPDGVAAYHATKQPVVANPCGDDNGGCQHLCVISHKTDNSGLGYRCLCAIGFELDTDQKSCKDIETFLLFSTLINIRGVSLEGSHQDAMFPIAEPNTNYEAIGYSAPDKYVYFDYVDVFGHALSRVKLDGTGFEHLVADIAVYVDAIAVDWLSRNYYWVDSYYGMVFVAQMEDTKGIKDWVNLVTGIDGAYGLAVNPMKGYMFWSSVTRPSSIWRAWMDGSNAVSLIDTALGEPHGLAIDFSTDRIYWTDAQLNKIEFSDYDGNGRTTLSIQEIASPWGVAIYGEYLYFSELRLSAIQRVDKSTGDNEAPFVESLDFPLELRLYDANLHATDSNFCSDNANGGCEYFCFPIPDGGRVCGCPYGMMLDDNSQDCIDDPDVPILTCPDGAWECPENGRCISISYLCDGDNDCLNNDDEKDCIGSCSSSAVTCGDGSCVSFLFTCDGNDDCNDGADEIGCPTETCTSEEFQCTEDGLCIPEYWKCDTIRDCKNGSDEVNCEDHECDADQFSCETIQECIPLEWVCDGTAECPDGTDEEQNCGPIECTSDEFTCANQECVSFSYTCDGIYDCTDFSDETSCPTAPSGGCHSDEIQCQTSGVCLPASWGCDGHVDCDDGTDEFCTTIEPTPPGTCSSELFTCVSDGRCIPHYYVCDYYNDCADESDEHTSECDTEHCPDFDYYFDFSSFTWYYYAVWTCPETLECIPEGWVCDDFADCGNGEDEGDACNTDLCEVNNGGCEQICFMTPFGAECDCNAGYTGLIDDEKICQDINECEEDGKCSQLCTNEKGSYSCDCVDNYELDSDGFTCKSTDPFSPFLVISNRDSLIQHNIRDGSSAYLLTHPDLAVGTDFYYAESKVYWSDAEHGIIYKSSIDGATTEELVNTGILLTESLAVDWVAGNLYWTDSELDSIEVARVDGSHRTVLFSQDISQPRGLVLDPRDGYHLMFWTDWGQSPRIERAGMDGSNRSLIISTDLYWPNGLALDLPNDRLYFGDAGNDVIEYCNYDGSGRSVVLHSTQHLQHLHSLTVFENYVYWTDRANNQVSKVPKFLSSAENVTDVLVGLDDPLDLHTYHPAIQPSAFNPCENNPCSHICLLSPNDMGYSCSCPVGTTLLTDTTCSEDLETFLIYAQESQIAALQLDPEDTSVMAMVPIIDLENVYDLDIDLANLMLYWIQYEEDDTRGIIHRVSIRGENATEFVPTAYVGAPLALSIDWISRNIYWTNPEKHTIEVMQLDGDNWRSVIISDVDEPISICVDPFNGNLYWVDNGSPTRIVSAKLNGENENDVISDDLDNIGFITIDIEEQKLYWANIDKDSIEMANTDGTERNTVVNGLAKPRGLAIYGDYLYYADAGYEWIRRVFKVNGSDPVTMKSSLQDLQALLVTSQPDGSNGCSANSNCQHLCLPTGPSTMKCACSTGFSLNPDGQTCSSPSSFAVVSQLSVIRGFSLDSSEHDEAMVPVAGTDRYTLHVDSHVDQNYIYFADFYDGDDQSHAIRRVRPDGSELTDIIADGIGDNGIRGLAVDWMAGNIYFTNAYIQHTYLEVCRLNGTHRRVLYQTTLDKPRTIAVNPFLKYLYWCDYGQTPKIVRADLDSSNQITLVDTNVITPRDISIDITTNNVFWVDTDTDTLERISWDGTGRVTIRSDLPNPYGLAVFNDSVYWVDRTLEKIYQADKEPGSLYLASEFRSDLDDLRDIAIFDEGIQPYDDSQNGCAVSNGGCEELCFAQADTSVLCMCAFGTLTDDGKSCLSPTEDYLVYSIQTELQSIHLDPSDLSQPFSPFTTPSQAIGVDFDYENNKIFYTDISERTINYILNSGERERTILLEEIDGVVAPEGIAYDWVNDRIFWTDYGDGMVRSMLLADGSKNVETVAQGLAPRAIVAHPCEGRIYWTDWQMFSIEKASMSGAHREVVVDTDIFWPNGLSIDYDEELLYWCDAYLDKIERSSLDGTNREVIIHASIHPFSLTVFGDHVYWTDWSLAAVIRADKHTGANEVVLVQELPELPMDIHFVSSTKQTCDYTPCSVNNGGCTDECIPEITGAACQCFGDSILSPDLKTCVDSSSDCRDDEFWCINGNCVSFSARCNLVDDCGDGSDESQTLCEDLDCSSTNEYTCNNGYCIPLNFLCDFINDCPDNSDEDSAVCNYPTCNPATEWTCLSGRCISSDYRCDTYNDCNDEVASDELDCPSRAPCPQYHTACETSNMCVLVIYLCDGQNDCPDGSDENPTTCSGIECPYGWWQCTEQGACMPPQWHCDGIPDCIDGSDEPPDCDLPGATCFGSQFTCDNGNCVPEELVCDGQKDCSDGSDEGSLSLNCEDYTCDPYYFTCTSESLGPKCIDPFKICDGEADCVDAEDEMQNCPYFTCNGDQFPCDNGLCIPLSGRCDFYFDCGDSSDENGCENLYPKCDEADEFTCHNQRCIPKSYQCDGIDDCGDTSDETTDCDDPVCADDEFMCSDERSTCINIQFICNGENNCPDGDDSDEVHCGVNECEEGRNQCSHECVNTATSYYCKCPEGMTLMEDQLACRDVDECIETPWVCSQLCENTDGSFICKCADGYAKEPDGVTCRHTDDVEPLLLYSNRYYIRRMTLDGQNFFIVKEGLDNVVALDFSYWDETLYFADIPDDAIYQMYLNGSGMETIFHSDTPDVEGISVDWVSRKLYFVDRLTEKLDVAELDGSYRRTLIDSGLMEPRAVAVHPKIGYVYWTDWGLGNEQISRVGMDGQNRSKIIQDKLGWPNALAFDYSCDKMYWADAHLDVIESSFLDGSGRYRIIEENIAHPFAISVFESYMYWSDWNELRVYKANKMTGEEKQILEEPIHRPMDLHIYHPLRQPDWPNPCGDNNGGCSHLCLITAGGEGFTCACTEDFLLDSDGTTCLANCGAHQFQCVDHEKCISDRFLKCDGREDCSDGSDEPDSCPPRVCEPGVYQCPNGVCVPTYWVCDGWNDCENDENSDEQDCESHECDPYMWKCPLESICIFETSVCNGVNDCGESSDESSEFCLSRTCEPGEFTCDNGFCIPEAWHCDFDNDCGDSSDEPQEFCVTQPCKESEFSCEGNYRCIPDYYVCDGYNDCRDEGSDEYTEMCSESTCPVGDFKCETSFECFPDRWHCDHIEDCSDGSDEVDCPTPECSESEFRCETSQICLPGSWKCDHEEDCLDGSDELAENCGDIECEIDEWQCASGHCIPESYRCDIYWDCPDISDEMDCPVERCGEYFACENSVCIPVNWVCDGEDDCLDNSDETASSCSLVDCEEENRFQCADGVTCIHTVWQCDGKADCEDGSDEVCVVPPVECAAEEYRCENQDCVPLASLCNGADDCGDLTDEIGCHRTDASCEETKNGGCEELCTDTDTGYICHCSPGFILDTANFKDCVDVDECVDGPNPCAQVCVNEKGGYKCECAAGYIDEGLGTNSTVGEDCRADGEKKYFLFTNSYDIRLLSEATNSSQDIYGDVVNHQYRIETFDYDYSGKKLYWTDSYKKSISWGFMPQDSLILSDDSQGEAYQLHTDLAEPNGIAVDWIGRNLYWTDMGSDSEPGKIEVSRLDGHSRKTLINLDNEQPGVIVLDPENGWMYWINMRPEKPSIGMAYMNGEHQDILVEASHLQYPTGLAIDFASSSRRLYWSDQKAGIVGSVDSDGKNMVFIKQGESSNPYRLEVFESSVFWTSQVSGQIHQLDKLGQYPTTTIEGIHLDKPSDIKVFQELRYPTGSTRCKLTDEGVPFCSHICLLVPNSWRCACPEGTDFVDGSIYECNADTDLPPCECVNGVCIEESSSWKCQCSDNWEGEKCDTFIEMTTFSNYNTTVISKVPPSFAPLAQESSISSGMTAMIVLLVLLVLVILAAFLMLYKRKYKRSHNLSTQDHGVSFRHGTNVDVNLGLEANFGNELPPSNGQMEFSLEDGTGNTQFANPVYTGGVAAGVAEIQAESLPEKTPLPPDNEKDMPNGLEGAFSNPMYDLAAKSADPNDNSPPPSKGEERYVDPHQLMVAFDPLPLVPPAYSPMEEGESDMTDLVEKTEH